MKCLSLVERNSRVHFSKKNFAINTAGDKREYL
nr:MAG TPA: hypothetical protein [Caudoviricetes sp.]